MHPELLNNSTFLQYYRKLMKNPDSVVFTSIADYLLKYGHVDEARKVCEDGLKRNPNLMVGRIVMAKINMQQNNFDDAEEELRHVLSSAPRNEQALALMTKIEGIKNPVSQDVVAAEKPAGDPDHNIPMEMQTITIARIFASQGHADTARQIFNFILEREPGNEDARQGLAAINS